MKILIYKPAVGMNMKRLEIPETYSEFLKKLGALSVTTNMPVYAVGGFVRDMLLDRTVHEIDFVVIGNGPLFAARAREALQGYGWVVYERFGTASFRYGEFKFEFVTARKESYSMHSRKPIVQQATLEEDLSRRDFTMNAMAMALDPDKYGKIIDPYSGRTDLKHQVIRTPLNPETTFAEDPLRIMRAARFAGQLNFQVYNDALEAMKKERSRLQIVSQERITDEILKILSQDQPSVGFYILLQTGVLEIIWPELFILTGIEQRDEYHHKDVFEHTMKVLDNVAAVSENPLLRFTALIHDIGKPRVKRFDETNGWTFHGHETVGVRMLKLMVPRLKLPGTYLKYSQKLTSLHMRPIQLIGEEVTDSAIRRLLVHAGDYVQDLMTLCRADITSGNPARVKKHLQNFDHVVSRMNEVEAKDRLRAFQSPVRGDEIMKVCGLKPGPRVGQLKKMIEEAILEGLIPNEHDEAYEYLLKIKGDLPS
jgi:poly(A) polymerase